MIGGRGGSDGGDGGGGESDYVDVVQEKGIPIIALIGDVDVHLNSVGYCLENCVESLLDSNSVVVVVV
jgi:hypothetical protein